MELRRIELLLFKLLYLVAAGIIVTQVLGMESLTSLLFLMTFPITILLWIRSVRKTITAVDLIMLGTILLAVVNVLINVCVEGGGLNFSYVKKLIIFSMSLLFLQTAYRFRINGELVRFINIIVDLITIFLMFMYFTQYTRMHLLEGRVNVCLTFRFSNPNLTALFLICLYMLKMYRLFTPDKWYVKIYHILLSLMLAWFVVETQSRNCLLVMLLFTLISARLIFRGKRKLRISKGWAVGISVFPALFVVGYMAVISTKWIQDMFSFMVGEGKKLNSRVKVWGPALEDLASSPIFGAYYQISGGTGQSQMHNSHLDIAASYGILVLILVCILLTIYIYQKGRYYKEKSNFIYIMGFSCAILLGMGEAAVFSGGLGIYIFAGTFMLLANRKDGDKISGG